MPSNKYIENKALFDQVFQTSGIAPFVEERSFEFYRLITGVEEQYIDPNRCSNFEQRFNNDGDRCLFGTPDPIVASLEVLGTSGCADAPENSWFLKYGFSGLELRIDRIQHGLFKDKFHQLSGDDKHAFSRDCRYYLESNQMITGADMVTWDSASGMLTQHGGDVVGWLPQNSGTLEFIGYEPVVSP